MTSIHKARLSMGALVFLLPWAASAQPRASGSERRAEDAAPTPAARAEPATPSKTWLLVTATAEADVPPRITQAFQAWMTERGYRLVRDQDVREGIDRGIDVVPIPSIVRDRLRSSREQVLEDVAFGRLRRVVRAVDELLTLAADYLPVLGDGQDVRHWVADLAGFETRAYLERGREKKARAAVARGISLVPGLTLTPDVHPPSVIRFWNRVSRKPTPSTLQVVVHGGVRCQLYINGFHVGYTPARMQVHPGKYAVSVNCEGRPSRVHLVQVPPGDTIRLIRPRLDQALEFGSPPQLRYPDPGELEGGRRAHAIQMAQALRAERILLLMDRGAYYEQQRYRIELMHFESGRLSYRGGVVVREPVTKERVADIMRALRGGARLQRELDAGAADRAADKAKAGSPPHHADGPGPTPEMVIGATLGLLSLAGVGTSWGLVGIWKGRADAAARRSVEAADFVATQQRRDALRPAVYAVGGISTVGLIVAEMLALPEESGVPAYGWAMGAAGAVAMAAGAIVWAQENQCGNDTCTILQRGGEPVGPLMLMQGASLAAVPLVYLFRDWLGESDPPAVSFRPIRQGFLLSASLRAP